MGAGDQLATAASSYAGSMLLLPWRLAGHLAA